VHVCIDGKFGRLWQKQHFGVSTKHWCHNDFAKLTVNPNMFLERHDTRRRFIEVLNTVIQNLFKEEVLGDYLMKPI
jgi:hypothetical protein